MYFLHVKHILSLVFIVILRNLPILQMRDQRPREEKSLNQGQAILSLFLSLIPSVPGLIFSAEHSLLFLPGDLAGSKAKKLGGRLPGCLMALSQQTDWVSFLPPHSRSHFMGLSSLIRVLFSGWAAREALRVLEPRSRSGTLWWITCWIIMRVRWGLSLCSGLWCRSSLRTQQSVPT